MPERDRAFVFVGSSTEGLGLARVIREALKREAAVRLWTDEEVFPLGRPTLTSLLEEAARADFAVLVLTPDDRVRRRGRERWTPRDNLIFEAGLFAGALGPERTFLVHPKELREALPSDLAGITTAEYPGGATTGRELRGALARIRRRLRSLGRRGFVELELVVEVPPTTPPELRVSVAGTLDRLGRHLPHWEPGIELERRSATSWSVTLEGPEGVALEYKYMLGPPWDWSHVEAWPDGSERANRHLVLRRAPIYDTVESWR